MGIEEAVTLLSTSDIPHDVPLSIRDLVGRPVRVIDYDAVATAEYVPRRVTIRKTEEGRIESISIEPAEKNS